MVFLLNQSILTHQLTSQEWSTRFSVWLVEIFPVEFLLASRQCEPLVEEEARGEGHHPAGTSRKTIKAYVGEHGIEDQENEGEESSTSRCDKTARGNPVARALHRQQHRSPPPAHREADDKGVGAHAASSLLNSPLDLFEETSIIPLIMIPKQRYILNR